MQLLTPRTACGHDVSRSLLRLADTGRGEGRLLVVETLRVLDDRHRQYRAGPLSEPHIQREDGPQPNVFEQHSMTWFFGLMPGKEIASHSWLNRKRDRGCRR